MKSKSSPWNILERIFSGRWIAGPFIEDAVRRAKEINAQRMSVLINYLGEQFTDKRDVADAVSTYLQLIRAIRKNHLDAGISMKITQLGLRISKGLARRNYEKIVRFARKEGVFVALDMEDGSTIDDTISIYERQARKKGIGIGLQAYRKRSERDMIRLVRRKAVIRLVKGAYQDSPKLIFRERKEVTKNYILLMRYLFRNAKEFTIATHDPVILKEAMLLNRSYRKKVIYAMLNGIRNGYAASLAASGNRVLLYVPFGTRWVDYSTRRLRELSHILLVLRSLFGG